MLNIIKLCTYVDIIYISSVFETLEIFNQHFLQSEYYWIPNKLYLLYEFNSYINFSLLHNMHYQSRASIRSFQLKTWAKPVLKFESIFSVSTFHRIKLIYGRNWTKLGQSWVKLDQNWTKLVLLLFIF